MSEYWRIAIIGNDVLPYAVGKMHMSGVDTPPNDGKPFIRIENLRDAIVEAETTLSWDKCMASRIRAMLPWNNPPKV